MNRSEFIQKSVGAGALLLPAFLATSQQNSPKPDPLKIETVREFVRVAHSNLALVQDMLEKDHLLLHASFDLGGGDFESAIEAAGHVGNKEIANYLLGKGARYNIFLASMFGNLEVVKNVLTTNPQLLNARGPHGLTLLHHARKGGESSKPVEEYLMSLGATQTKIDFYAKT